MSSNCGCTARSYRCVDGGDLIGQALMLAEAIESPFFDELSEVEQKQLWEERRQIVQAYTQHCSQEVQR